jgi:hypothetical protein
VQESWCIAIAAGRAWASTEHFRPQCKMQQAAHCGIQRANTDCKASVPIEAAVLKQIQHAMTVASSAASAADVCT